jgi:carboxyl-terminal processing protease
MLPSSNKGAGMTFGFPDVCNTPVGPATVPIPYPNFGMHAMATPFSPNVLTTMCNALNQGSIIPLTTGDQAGVAHPTIMGSALFTMGNPVVYINMLPGINQCCPNTANNMNDGLAADLVPSVTNVFFTRRTGESVGAGLARPLGEGALREMSDDTAIPRASLIEPGVGYVEAPAFSGGMPTRMVRAIDGLVREGLRALVIDLRDNPGGDVDAFVRFAEELLPRGSVLARRTDPDGDENEIRARHEAAYRFPLFLLVNRWTASAAELFAGCLQWHGRATLVGERTYGKGAGRKVISTKAGFFEVDAAMFSLPGGEPLEGVGLAPNVETRGERGEGDDALALACSLARAALGAGPG